MTSAATPAVSGADSLVPPKDCRSVGCGGDWKLRQPEKPGSQTAQLPSPGAARSTVRPNWLMPDEDSAEMLSLIQVLLEKGTRRRSSARTAGCRSSPATWMTFGSGGEPIVLVIPASPSRHGDRHAGGDRRVVEERQRVARADVRVGVQAERLVDDVDVIGAHGVVDRLQDRGVAAEYQPDQAGAGRDTDDPDVAAGRQRVRLVHELREVVDDGALRGDRRCVAECLAAVRRRARAGAGEVLVVDEDVLAVGPDEVGVVRVDAVGDEGDLDARAGRQLLGVRAAVGRQCADRLQRLWLDQRLRRVGRAEAIGPFAFAGGATAAGFVVEEPAGAGWRDRDRAIRDDGRDRGSCASAAACASVTVAEKALPSAKCLTCVGAAPVSRLSTASWALVARARRGDMSCLLAGVLAS